jgi:hypothetical protein
MSYNGWTNWETWLTNLHVLDGLTARDINGSRTVTADEVRDYVDEFLDTDGHSTGPFTSDIIRGFMSEVDWRELADHLNVDDDEDDEEE